MLPTNTTTEEITPRTQPSLAQRLRAALRVPAGDGGDLALTAALRTQHPADIAEAMSELARPEALAVFNWLDNVRAAEVLDEVDSELVRYILDNAPPGRIADLLDRLPMDDAAEVVSEASRENAEELLAALSERSPEDAAEVRELLSYGDQTAGRLMTDKFMRLTGDSTVDKAFDAIRHADPDVETLNDLYVVEPHRGQRNEERLLGVLSLRDLVRARPSQRIRDIMVRDPITVTVDTDQEEVARLISKYDFLAMPVLDRNGSLAGIVTVDDVVDVLVEEQTEDVLKQSGISVEPGVINQPYFTVPVLKVFRSRIGWLMLLFVAETATGVVLRHFEDELARVVALSFYVPLLIGTGGNTGAQTVSTIIRGIALKEIRGKDTGRVLVRELISGLLLGLALGAVGFGRALLWDHSPGGIQIALVVGLTILAICTWANTIGSLIPLLAQRLKIDPALVSAPLITTLVDATGLAIYLTIAKVLLTQLH
ncbi:MAG: magnesium transporter [Cytophagales bacterium]|nr:magnesium transporter [Armatimonadota bacterium]